MLEPDTVVGMSLTGALTPAGLGMSCLIPLIEHGFIDWMVSTGANLYHDAHFGLGLKMFQGSAEADDVALRNAGVVRIYDIFFDYRVLLSTDAFFRELARHDGVPTLDGNRRISLPRRPLRCRTRARVETLAPLAAGRRT